jgi:hypothetical protein
MTVPAPGHRFGTRLARRWRKRPGAIIRSGLDALRRGAQLAAHKVSGPQLLVVSFAALR